MQIREIKKTVAGRPARDGAGVHLTRVISQPDVYDFDPFLLLDAFDSTNPDDYILGFHGIRIAVSRQSPTSSRAISSIKTASETMEISWTAVVSG